MSSAAASSTPRQTAMNTSSQASSRSTDIHADTQRPLPPSPSQRHPTASQRPSDSTRAPDDGVEADALGGLRQSAEYRAAWDMEMWKAVQAERFRQQLERQRAKALADLARTVKRKEQEAEAALAQRSAALTAKESRLEKALQGVAQQEARLTEEERGLRRMRQQLLDAQRRVEDEVRAQVRRANDDITHKALLLQDRVKAAEAQAKRAEERQRQAQADYLELYEEFHRFRTQQLTAPASNSRSSRGGEAGEDSQLAGELVRQRAAHQEELRLLREGLEQRHRAELADLVRSHKELEEQNRRLTAALARRREQLRGLRGASASANHATSSSSSRHAEVGSTTASVPAAAPLANTPQMQAKALSRELDRLRRERTNLIVESGGAITESDAVVRRLDARITELTQVLQDMAALR